MKTHPLPSLLTAIAAAIAIAAPGFVRAGDPPAATAATSDAVPAGVVDGPTARRLVDAGVKVVDVRTADEFRAGHVPGAINIPFDQIAARAGELGPASTPLLLYCRTGRRSGIAVKALQEKGYARLYDLRSFDLWLAAGGAAER